MLTIPRFAKLSLALLTLAAHSAGQCEIGPLGTPDGTPTFGRSIAGGDERMAVSDPSGTGYVYRRFHELADIELDRPAGHDGVAFGAGLAIGEGRVAAGDPTDGAGGAVFVFDTLSGEVLGTLTGAAGDDFGQSVLIHAGRLWVGAPGVAEVRAFDIQSLAQVLTLTDPGGEVSSRFGQALDAVEARLGVGAPDAGGVGAVHVFDLSGTPISTWQPAAPAAGMEFGRAVALRGPLGVVGARGEAWIHAVETGAPLLELAPSAPTGDEFGARVLLGVAGAAVADPGSDLLAPDAGAVHRYDPWSGSAKSVWIADHAGAGARFGEALGVCGTMLVAGSGGAPGVSILVEDAPDLNANGIPDDCEPLGTAECESVPNSSTYAAHALALGTAEAGGAGVVLVADGLPFDQPGYFLCSASSDHVPGFGGSQGILCLGAPITRLSHDVLLPNAGGIVSLCLGDAALPATATFDAGETWVFQYWFRDQNPDPTSNTSDAVRVVFHL